MEHAVTVESIAAGLEGMHCSCGPCVRHEGPQSLVDSFASILALDPDALRSVRTGSVSVTGRVVLGDRYAAGWVGPGQL